MDPRVMENLLVAPGCSVGEGDAAEADQATQGAETAVGNPVPIYVYGDVGVELCADAVPDQVGQECVNAPSAGGLTQPGERIGLARAIGESGPCSSSFSK